MKIFKPTLQNIFFYQKYVHLGENTLIYCSQKTVVHVHVNGFLKKFIQACQSDANGIKPGSNQKMTYKHAAEYSKAVC